MDIDIVKGYKGDINQIPKHVKRVVKEKFVEQYGEDELKNIKEYVLDVHTYINVDLNNSWKK